MPGSIVTFPGRPRRRAVTTFPLSRSAIDSLQAAVGDAITIVDVKDADGTEDLVVVSSVSRQLLGKLRAAFPGATVLVVEVEDGAHRVGLGGPVMRALDAGADGYLVAHSVDELGAAITRAASASQPALAPGDIVMPALDADDGQLDEVLDTILRSRTRDPAPAGAEEPPSTHRG